MTLLYVIQSHWYDVCGTLHCCMRHDIAVWHCSLWYNHTGVSGTLHCCMWYDITVCDTITLVCMWYIALYVIWHCDMTLWSVIQSHWYVCGTLHCCLWNDVVYNTMTGMCGTLHYTTWYDVVYGTITLVCVVHCIVVCGMTSVVQSHWCVWYIAL